MATRGFKAARLGVALALVFLAVAGVGCPRPKPVLNVPDPQLSLDNLDEGGVIHLDNTGGGKLTWSASADVPWIVLGQTSGSGEADIQVTVDSSKLKPLALNEGVITITSSGGTQTVHVSVPTPVLALNPEYWPLAVGNSWNFGMASMEAATKLLKVAEPTEDTVLTLTVADKTTVGALDVWQIDLTSPVTAYPQAQKVAYLKYAPEVPAIPTYWVKVDGQWFLTFDEDNLAALPSTDKFIAATDLVKLYGYAVYFLGTDRLEELSADLAPIMAELDDNLAPIAEELADYIAAIANGDTEDIYALLNAFSEAYEDVSFSNPLLNDVVEFSADLAGGIDEAELTAKALQEILANTQDDLDTFVDAHPDLTPQDLAPFLTAFSTEFAEYESDDLMLQTAVRLVAVAAEHGATFVETLPELTEEEQTALYEYLDALSEAADANADLLTTDPVAFVDALIAFAEAYETETAIVQDAIATTLDMLNTVRVLAQGLDSYTVEDLDFESIAAVEAALSDFVTEYAADNPQDPIGEGAAIVMEGVDAATDELETLQPWFAEMRADVEQLAETLKNPSRDYIRVAGYTEVVTDLKGFFEEYDTANDDVLAQACGLYLQAMEEALVVFAEFEADLDSLSFRESSGSLSSLLVTEPYTVALADFGIADQDDCIAAQIMIPEGAQKSDFLVPCAIWAEDIGPVLYGPLVLKSAEVNGVTYGGN